MTEHVQQSIVGMYDAYIRSAGDAYIDPFLDMAFSTGDEHGIDKTLRHWNVADFEELVVTRYRVAADTTRAASDFDSSVSRLIGRMKAEGADEVGDVEWGI